MTAATNTPNVAGRVDYPVRLPRAFLEEAWRYLTPRERAILPVLLLHIPNVFPGRARIGEMAGMSRKVVSQGLSELMAAGIITGKEQRKTPSGGWASNRYYLADLADTKVLADVLARLRRRGAPNQAKNRDPEMCREAIKKRWPRVPKWEHGWGPNGNTGRVDLGTLSHHQGKEDQEKSYQERGRKNHYHLNDDDQNRPEARSKAIGRPSDRSPDTVDPSEDQVQGQDPHLSGEDEDLQLKLQRELPDTASPHQMIEALKRRGVGGGRAATMANTRLCTPTMVRATLYRFLTKGKPTRSPGGYLGNMLADALTEAKTATTVQVRQAAAQQQAHFDQIVADIVDRKVPDKLLAEAIKSHGFTGMTPDVLRADPVLCRQVAPRLDVSKPVVLELEAVAS